MGAHPIAGSVAITVLTGLGLQLTHLIDFEERMSAVVGWTLQLRSIDFGFRMVLGALVVLVLLGGAFLGGPLRLANRGRDGVAGLGCGNHALVGRTVLSEGECRCARFLYWPSFAP